MFDESLNQDRQSNVEREIKALRRVEVEMRKLEVEHASWYALYDELMVDTATRAEMFEMMETAPTEFARGMIYGKIMNRIEIEAMTGRPFL